MAECEVCGKHRSFGHNVSHSKRRTNRDWLPNVQRKHVMIDGRERHIYICTRCQRTLTKPARMAARSAG